VFGLISFYKRLVFLFLVVALGFNYTVFNFSPPIYTVHILLAGMIVITFGLILLVEYGKLILNIAQFAYILAFLILMGVRFEQARFLEEFAKITLIFIVFYIFLVIYKNFRVSIRTTTIAFVLGTFISVFTMTNFTGMGLASLQSRLEVNNLGNFNAYGVLISIGFIQALYLFRTSSRPIAKILLFICMILFIDILLSTLSRGGTVTLLIGVLFFSLLAWKDSNAKLTKRNQLLTMAPYFILVSLFFIGALFLYEPLGQSVSSAYKNWESLFARLPDITSTGGSGRLGLWEFLLRDLWDSGLTGIVFGKGIGSIQLYYLESIFNSSHNLYISVLYQLGIIGLFVLLTIILMTFRHLWHLPTSNEKALLLAIFAQLVVGSVFDSYYGSSQVGWMFGFWFALFWAVNKRRFDFANKHSLIHVFGERC